MYYKQLLDEDFVISEMTKFSLEVLTCKSLSVWLEFIDETGEIFFLQMQIKPYVSHMWVYFVVGSPLSSERFFSGTPVFPSP